MPARIVVFGATGYTGRLVAEQLVAAGERPLLAGRSEQRLGELASAPRRARVAGRRRGAARARCSRCVAPGDVLVSTVGPFVKWGEPAVRAAIAAPAVYLDSTGEPPFIRRVFEEFGPPAARAGATLMTAMGYDFVPGALAGALALEAAGRRSRRRRGDEAAGQASGARRRRLLRARRRPRRALARHARVARRDRAGPGFAFRDGGLRSVRSAERVRDFTVRGKPRPAISVGGAEHFGLPAAYPQLREVNVYLGWFGPLARAAQAATLAGSVVRRVPGVPAALRYAGERLMALGGGPAPGTTSGALSWIAATAHDARGGQLAEVRLTGTDPYAFTAAFLAWAARRAAHEGIAATGAVGPLEAFGLDALRQGCAAAGLAPAP